MRIGILSQYYPPEVGAPQARLSEMARSFVKAGHEVFVLTALPSYPIGRIYEGYGGVYMRETMDGVVVIRTWVYPTRSVKMLPRLWNYFSFVLSSMIGGAVTLPKLDFLLTESPPLFLGISGWVLSLLCRARWIFNVSDLWPESAVHLGMVREGLALRMAEALETFCYRRAWLVSGQSREILSDIGGRHPERRLYHLSNGVDTNLFTPRAASSEVEPGDEPNRCEAIYAGLHGVAQGLGQLLDAAEQLKPLTGFRMSLVGDGPEKQALVEDARRRQLNNVAFLDPKGRSEMPRTLAKADLAIIPLRMHLPGAVPSKIYEAMAAGLAIVLVAEGEAADIVRSGECGWVVSPGDTPALVEALRIATARPDLRRQYGNAGRRLACEKYDRTDIVRRFHEYLGQAMPTVTLSTMAKLGFAVETALERLACIVSLLILSPLLLAVALAIALEDGSPILFRQQRVGHHGSSFEILKFRTMRARSGGREITLAGDDRITRVGRFLRRFKLDELPQLWNVVRGDMSLVGPRPEVPQYVDLQNPDWQAALAVRPGITCVSSVIYRDEGQLLASVEDPDAYYREIVLPRKLRMSIHYLRRRTPLTDLGVIFTTLLVAVWPSYRPAIREGSWQ
ncbi:MAG: sugar transferase [Acidobacteriota bacterium]